MKNNNVLNIGKLHNPDIRFKFRKFNPNLLKYSVYSCIAWSTSSGIYRVDCRKLIGNFNTKFFAEQFVFQRLSGYYRTFCEYIDCLEVINCNFEDKKAFVYVSYFRPEYCIEHDTDNSYKTLVILRNF